MKRPAQPGEGEIPIGASEIPGPMAYTDPETGERVIDDTSDVLVHLGNGSKILFAAHEPEPVKAPKIRRRKAS